MHARVADDHDLVDPLREHARLAADLLDVLVQEADDPRVQLAQIAGIELRERDPRHEVPAEHRLGIQARDRRELLARLELHQGGHDARGADVDRQAELHDGGIAALHRKDPRPAARRARRVGSRHERGHGHARRIVAKRRRQSLHDGRADVGGGEADGFEELLEVGGLVMLLARQGDLDHLLGHARIERHAAELAYARPGAEDLERALVERRRRLDGDGLVQDALTGQAIALAHQVVAELDLVHDRRRRRQAGQELDPARRAAAAPAAGRRDVDAARVRRLEDRRPRRDAQRPARGRVVWIGDEGQRDGHGLTF